MGRRDEKADWGRRAGFCELIYRIALRAWVSLTDFSIKKVKLLIIDEVHLLNEERGAVIETIVARTLRQVRKRGFDSRFSS